MLYILAHIIGHGWRDLLLYGGAGLGMAGGFWIFISGRSARLRQDLERDANDAPADQLLDETFFRGDDVE